MSLFRNYNPLLVVLSWNGIIFQGYHSGSMIEAARNTDSFAAEAGTQGDVVRVRSLDRIGRVTAHLQQSSPTNDQLSARLLADELFGTQVGPMLLKDLNGSTLIEAADAWLVRPTDLELSDTVSPRDWMIDCAQLLTFVGGSTI